MNYFFYASLFILLMVFLGMGLALLLTPKELRKYALLLAPIIGYCYMTLAGWYCYIADFQGTDETALYILILPLLFILLAYWRIRPFNSNIMRPRLSGTKAVIPPIIIGLFGFVFSSLPFLLSPDIISMDNLTSISLGANDIADTSTIATYLKKYARSDTVGFLGQVTEFLWLPEKSIFGGSYSTAFASTILSLETYQLQSMSLHVFFFFAVCLLFVLATEGFGYSRPGALIITGMFSVNSLIYYAIFHGSQGQIYTLPLSLLLYLLFISALQSANSLRDYMRYSPLTVLLLWGISITYPHILPIILAPILFYAVLLAIVKKQYKRIGWFFVYLMITGIISAMLAPGRAYSIVSISLFMGRVEAGWFLPLLSLGESFGVNFYDWDFTRNPGLIDLIISSVLIILSGMGMRKVCKRDISVALLSAAFLTTIICGSLVFGYLDQESGQLGGYKSFKFVSYLLPVLMLSALVWMRQFSFKGLTDGGKTIMLALTIIGLVGLATFSAGKLISKVVDSHLVVDYGLANLKEINRNNRIQSVNVLSKNWWDTLWIVNFLIEKKLYFEINTYHGRNASKLLGAWDIFRCMTPGRDVLLIPDGTIYSDDGFVLKEVKSGGLAVDAYNARLTPRVNRIQLRVNEHRAVVVRIKNDSRTTWLNDCRYEGTYALNLSYHVRDMDGRIIVLDGARSSLPNTVAPGQEIVVEAVVKAPGTTGQYVIEFDLVQEAVVWFADKGSKTATLGLTVE